MISAPMIVVSELTPVRGAIVEASSMTNTQDPKSLSQARYTRFADGYVTSETHAHGSDLDRLIAIAQPQAHWQALDIATGGGHTALKFAPRLAHVIASDLTPRMLEKARRHIVGDKGATNVSFPGGGRRGPAL